MWLSGPSKMLKFDSAVEHVRGLLRPFEDEYMQRGAWAVSGDGYIEPRVSSMALRDLAVWWLSRFASDLVKHEGPLPLEVDDFDNARIECPATWAFCCYDGGDSDGYDDDF